MRFSVSAKVVFSVRGHYVKGDQGEDMCLCEVY